MDQELRRLERAAQTGDPVAYQRYWRKLYSIGGIPPEELFLTYQDPAANPVVLAYRIGDGKGNYYHHGRLIPDAEEDAMYHLVEKPIYLVHATSILDINYDTMSAFYFNEDAELDNFIARYQPDHLIHLLEDGAVLLKHPIPIQQMDCKNIYHPQWYDKEDILYREETISFPHTKVQMIVKDPGIAARIITIYNRFENIQLACNEGSPEEDIDFYRDTELAQNHGCVEHQRLFDNIFMFVAEYPENKKANFQIISPPAIDINNPRIKELVKKGAIFGDIKQLTRPTIQTIYGTVVFAKMADKDPEYNQLPWPWNEAARDEDGLPIQVEIESLSADEVERILKFLETGILSQ